MNATVILSIIELIINKGIPVYVQWQDGQELKNPTLDEINKLHVMSMTDKLKEFKDGN